MTKLLDDYYTRPEVATELGVCTRSVARYENQPDGLPYAEIGGRKLYPKDETRAWLKRRLRKPNPTRKYAAVQAVAS